MLERIGAVDVRCLTDFSLEPVSGTNLLVGDNGAGKTSVLESIYLLGRGRSFRAANLSSVVTTGKPGFAIRGRVSTEEQRARTVGLKWTQGRTSGQIDSRDADSLAELARAFPIEIIDTQVQEIVRGGPGQRRRYLDWGVFHVEHSFIDAWRRYSRALKQRNAALRQPIGISPAKVWEEELSVSGTLLDEARSRYVQLLIEDVGELVEDLLGAPISVTYAKGWPDAMTLAEALDRGRERDVQRGATSVGPHRADLDILLDGQSAREHSSGGQQKLLACALVLAQVRLVGEVLGRSPVLLIDDPGAEVADSRLNRLMEWVEALVDQRFVTGLAAEVLGVGADAMFHVEQGRVTRVR